MKRIWLIGAVLLSLAGSTARAADLHLELHFSAPLSAPTAVTVAYDGLFPVGGTEIGSGERSADLTLSGLEPGPYQLYLLSGAWANVRMFSLTLSADGAVQFDPSVELSQNANRVTITNRP